MKYKRKAKKDLKIKEPKDVAFEFYDTAGNKMGANRDHTDRVKVSSTADENGYYTFTIDMKAVLADGTMLTAESLLAKIVIMTIHCGDNKDGVAKDLTIDSITYTKA